MRKTINSRLTENEIEIRNDQEWKFSSVGGRLSPRRRRRMTIARRVAVIAAGFAASLYFGGAYVGGEGMQQREGRNPTTTSKDVANRVLEPRGGSLEGTGHGTLPISIGLDEDYRISPNDVLEIRIEKAEELSGSYPVDADGTFEMHFLGEVEAKGKTTEQVAKLIADGLRGRYLVDPLVRVSISQRAGRSYFVLGAVRNPGLVQVGGHPHLLELITLAGGPTENHGASAYLIRKSKQSAVSTQGEGENVGQPAASPSGEATAPKYDLLKVSINGLLKGMFGNNIAVEPGDIINIPQTDVFFISGEVTAPGSYPLKEGTTLRQAISIAQGVTLKAASGRGVLFREDPSTGQRTEKQIDIGAIMRGNKEDIPLLANDIIILPTSKMKSFGSVVLTAFGYSSARYVPVPIRRY